MLFARIAAACALCCSLAGCFFPPPYHGGGWHDPHGWHGGPDHGGPGRR